MMSKFGLKASIRTFLMVLWLAIPAWGFTLTTEPPENVNAVSATGNAALIPDNGQDHAIKWGFCYGVNADPDISGLHTEDKGVLHKGVFTGCIINLHPNTTYHIRAYAYSDQNDITYGNDFQFTTSGIYRHKHWF